jgi:hypothetical protein
MQSLGGRIMDPWRLATRAQRRINAIAGLALVSCVLAWLAGFGSAPIKHVDASIENTRAAAVESTSAVSIVERSEPTVITSAAASTEPAQKIVLASADIGDVVVAPAPDSVMAKVAEATANLRYEPISLFEISLADPSQVLSPEEPSTDVAMVSPTDAVPDNAQPAIRTLEINEECLVAEICIDRYLWALYERAPKVDAIKVYEQRKVTIKRKGKTKTVTRTFTRRVDEDFTWKDPKAAERAGMSMMDYVIGGMDRKFKLKLFHTLHAAEQAGLQPGITSAFRDDYRQGIASGLKAATDRSYHGGSTRGGYGRGLAADIVSVKGNSRAQRWVTTEKLWKWIDANGKDYGIGRPYLDRDPPHVAPTDGQEYVSRRGGAKTQEAEAKPTKTRVAMRDDRSKAKAKAKQVKVAKAAKFAKTAKFAKGAKTVKLARARTM